VAAPGGRTHYVSWRQAQPPAAFRSPAARKLWAKDACGAMHQRLCLSCKPALPASAALFACPPHLDLLARAAASPRRNAASRSTLKFCTAELHTYTRYSMPASCPTLYLRLLCPSRLPRTLLSTFMGQTTNKLPAAFSATLPTTPHPRACAYTMAFCSQARAGAASATTHHAYRRRRGRGAPLQTRPVPTGVDDHGRAKLPAHSYLPYTTAHLFQARGEKRAYATSGFSRAPPVLAPLPYASATPSYSQHQAVPLAA